MLKTDRALLEDILEQCLWIMRYGELADLANGTELSTQGSMQATSSTRCISMLR